MVKRAGHFKQALGADQVLTFDKAVKATPAIAGIEKRNEILENSVGG